MAEQVPTPGREPDDVPTAHGRLFPHVPAYAWTWLQRSRPVVTEAARRLTGEAPGAGFVDRLRDQFVTDPFVRDVVVSVIADVAFGGRAPARRPAATSWDRGLTWWAAALAGVTPAEFEARSVARPATQRPLFESDEPADPAPSGRDAPPARPRAPSQRAALAHALRQLLEAADGDQVPAAAVRQLIADLER